MIKFLIYTLLILFPATLYCAVGDNDVDGGAEYTDEEIRTSPVIEDLSPESITKISIPSFIKKSANSIKYNGADWGALYENLTRLKQHVAGVDNVVMLHIGDSHIQADYSTRRVREQLQANYGNAGRGLIIPFRLAKTNQPIDYSIKTNSNIDYASLLRKPWNVEVGFTGVALRPINKDVDMTISTLSTQAGVSTFDIVKIYHDGDVNVDEVKADGDTIENNSFTDIGGTVITLNKELASVELKLSYANNAPRIFGVELSRANPGVVYNTIGNNGATFWHYNELNNFGRWVSLLTPQVVIISLGCNEAFGNISADAFYRNIDNLVTTVKKNIPDALILLTTPMECQRAYTTYKKRRGRKRRRVRVTQYRPNVKVATLRNVIVRYSKDKKVALWDWYDIAGGAGASSDWIEDRLFSGDRIHHTAAGYQLQGELLYEALTKDIK